MINISKSQTMWQKIIHIDMDCFYAAVEMRENPSLASKPLAIGGNVNQRGVLSTCNYEARKFGLRSAMPTAHALKRCPNLILLPVNMPLYKAVSAQIHQIFQRYTEIVESISLDEAYLDVTDCKLYSGSATWIAQAIRNDIWRELHLTASAGIAPLKFLAKIASDQNKPNGQFVINPSDVQRFVTTLPLEKIPGVGKVTRKKLHKLGLSTCSDIQQADLAMIYREFGKFGQRLWEFSHGIDGRRVEVDRPRKSLAVENTLLEDIWGVEVAEKIINTQYETLVFRIQQNWGEIPLTDFKKLGIKLKFDDFTQTTLERTTDGLSLFRFTELLYQIWKRREGRKIRLIGLHVHFPEKKVNNQLNLWE